VKPSVASFGWGEVSGSGAPLEQPRSEKTAMSFKPFVDLMNMSTCYFLPLSGFAPASAPGTPDVSDAAFGIVGAEGTDGALGRAEHAAAQPRKMMKMERHNDALVKRMTNLSC